MAPAASTRRHVPFWGHQLAEYALAAALIVVGLHVTGRTELVLALSGGALALLAGTTKGPLAAVRVVPKRLHVVIDLVLAAGFFVAPLYYLPSVPAIPIIISEAVAVVLVRMSFTTELVPAVRPAAQARARQPRRGPVATRPPPARPSRPRLPLRRLAGSSAPPSRRARESRAPLTAARGLGRMTGHARRLGRAAAAGKDQAAGGPAV